MSEEREPRDLPREELLKHAQEFVAEIEEKIPGIKLEIHFKFTCKHCGNRCTFADPNILYQTGECDICGKITEVKQGGYLLLKL